MAGSIASTEVDVRISEIADDYKTIMAEEESLDAFFVAEDLGIRVDSGEIDQTMGEKVLEHMGIDRSTLEI